MKKFRETGAALGRAGDTEMNKLKITKAAIIGAWLLGGLLLLCAGSTFKSKAAEGKDKPKKSPPAEVTQSQNPADYVGAETCQACHEDQFKNFSKTPHAHIMREASWKGKVVGCESCHGAGKAHVELITSLDTNAPHPADLKIRSFKNESSKQISETCLQCHAGREEHNNFRRGEHWRNDVGCTDCHTTHAPDPAPPRPASHTLIAEGAWKKPDSSVLHMLKGNEQQLCLKCHAEQKAQFTQPFHHKVLEGTMKCSDCHNPHGGFELKQTRLATGSDAACVKCHTEKQGPFVYEHGPVKVEGCSSCHTPHGASNPKLLKRNQMFQLCIECHTNAHAISSGETEGAPNTPSFHNITLARYQNCTVCHVAIHGSNTHPFFFR